MQNDTFNELPPPSGFPAANFGIAAEVTPQGRILSRVMVNPPVLGGWLADLAKAQLRIRCDGIDLATEQMQKRLVERLWPTATLELSDDHFPGATFNIRVWSPVARGDDLATCLSVTFIDMFIRNNSRQSREVALDLYIQAEPGWSDGEWRPAPHCFGTDRLAVGYNAGEALLGTDFSAGRRCRLSVRVQAEAGAETPVRLALAAYHPDGYYASVAPDARGLAEYALARADELFEATDETSDLMPSTGDEKLDTYLRWYTAAGVMLTRLTRRGEVLTMGYCELNQRDSFWTSFVHMVFWPDLERRMIEESASAQREDGKIPTTILPVIERGDDIDINLYFCLRIYRWWAWTRDDEFAERLLPAYRKAIGFVQTLDRDGDGLPEQGSYWADWKDVPGVEGRKWGPHFILLYLAALQRGADMAAQIGHADLAREWRETARAASELVNLPVAEGGMWTGTHYANVWEEGGRDGHVLEDQVLPAIWGVIPPDRLAKVYHALSRNETAWGVRETYPYYDPDEFGLEAGDYHNGAVWPYLCFADALGRFINGYPADAERIMRNTGWGDLEWRGDWLPNENVHGETGESTHRPVQAWNADYFGAVFFGALGVSRDQDGTLALAPRIPLDRRVDTAVVLPEGVLRLHQQPGTVATAVTLTWQGERPLRVRYAAMVPPDRKGAQKLGRVAFAPQGTVTLSPGETAEFDVERP